MKILTYKRTHTGDPDAQGNFGIHDCMGRVRNWNFDAVIGVGSLKPWIGDEGIAGRVTWVGINPRRILNSDYRGDILNFENFLLLDSKGPLLQDEAPLLFKRMFERNARAILNSYSIAEKKKQKS